MLFRSLPRSEFQGIICLLSRPRDVNDVSEALKRFDKFSAAMGMDLDLGDLLGKVCSALSSGSDQQDYDFWQGGGFGAELEKLLGGRR